MNLPSGRSLTHLVVLLVLVAAGPALSQPAKVYRCGPDGRTYSDAPCPAGREINAADPRDADQQAQAQEVAQRERTLGDRLAAERRARERAAARQRAAGIDHERRDRLARADKSAPRGDRKDTKDKLGKQGPASGETPFTARAKSSVTP